MEGPLRLGSDLDPICAQPLQAGGGLLAWRRLARHFTAWGGPLILGFWALPRPAAAQVEEPREVSFVFEAPEGCGSSAEFAAQAGARLAKLRFLERGEASSVRVRLERRGAGVRAELVISRKGGRRLRRALDAKSCDEALDAIAFVAAVALDPDAAEPLDISDEPAGTLPTSEQATETETEAPPPDERHPRQAPAPARGGKDALPGSGPPAAQSAAVPSEWRVGASGVAVAGPAPQPLWGGGAFAGWFAGGTGLWVPSLELSFDISARGGFVQNAGTAEFLLLRASLGFCPSRFHWAFLELRGCGQLDGGSLIAEGVETFAAQRSVRPWLGAGLSLRGELAVADRFGLFLGASAELPLIRDSFQFDDQAFHRVPAMTGSARVGVSARFP